MSKRSRPPCRTDLTQQELMEVLFYDQNTGEFTWLICRCNSMPIGARAGCRLPTGYIKLSVGNRQYLAHRLAWLYVHGKWPEQCIDHINGDRSDNRIANLRDISPSANQHNRRCTAGRELPLGVHWSKAHKKFVAQIQIPGGRRLRFSFDDAESASAAYQEAKRAHHTA